MPANSPISLAGHIRIPGIAGESTRTEHEGEIEFQRFTPEECANHFAVAGYDAD